MGNRKIGVVIVVLTTKKGGASGTVVPNAPPQVEVTGSVLSPSSVPAQGRFFGVLTRGKYPQSVKMVGVMLTRGKYPQSVKKVGVTRGISPGC